MCHALNILFDKEIDYSEMGADAMEDLQLGLDKMRRDPCRPGDEARHALLMAKHDALVAMGGGAKGVVGRLLEGFLADPAALDERDVLRPAWFARCCQLR